MTEVLMQCPHCDTEIAVNMDVAFLRMDVEPRAAAELLFLCPACREPVVREVKGELLTLLLFVGVAPLRLSEPSLPAEDRAPIETPVTLDELLTWHELLADVEFVTPWQA